MLIEEHTQTSSVEYHIKNYGYIEESKIKLITYQIVKALQQLSNIGYTHG